MQSCHCFLGSESCFTAVQEESATLPHAQIHHCMWSVLPGLPRISSASNKHSGEKEATLSTQRKFVLHYYPQVWQSKRLRSTENMRMRRYNGPQSLKGVASVQLHHGV